MVDLNGRMLSQLQDHREPAPVVLQLQSESAL